MRVLICTPCGNGSVTVQYMLSLLSMFESSAIHKQQIQQQIIAQSPGFDPKNPQHLQGLQATLNQHTYTIGVYTMSNESLLGRGRNHMACTAMRQGWEKVLFIDADESWTWDDFKNVVSAPHPIVAGVVPLKTYVHKPHSFKTSLNYLPFFEDEKYYHRAIRDVASMERHAAAEGSPLIKVAFTGTGFLCIDINVFMKLAENADHYLYPSPDNGQSQSHWSYFDGGPINNMFLSEDWRLCDSARQAGFDIMVHTGVRIKHVGNEVFEVGNVPATVAQ